MFATEDDLLKIVSGDREWKINRYLACTQVEFFKGAFAGGLKEEKSGKVELKNLAGDSFSDEVIDLLVSYLNSSALYE